MEIAGQQSNPFVCSFCNTLSGGSCLSKQGKRNILSFPSWKRCRFFPAYHSRGTGGTFLQSEKSTQKRFFRIAQRSRGRSRKSGFAIAFVSCRLPVCTGLHDYSAFAGPARSCCDYPPYAKSLQTFFVSASDRRYLFVSFLSCSSWKLCAYRKGSIPFICQRGWV